MTGTRRIDEGPQTSNLGAWVSPAGKPGDVGVGTYEMAVSISTGDGPGEFSVSRIDIGFGLFQDHEDPPEDDPEEE
jgi:hypothetical protein